MREDFVSIVLCSYNGEKYIATQLDSILRQSHPYFELVIVDDCSTDRTFEICKNYATKHPQIRLYQNRNNIGLNRNFEKALQLAKGEYIAFSDQDDIWDTQKIEILLNHIHTTKAVLVYGNSEMILEDGTSTQTASTDHNVFVSGHNAKQLILYNTVSGHQMLFKKELLHHVLPLPDSFWYDWWIAYIAAGIDRIAFTEKKLVQYRIHKTSFVQSNKAKQGKRKQKIQQIITHLEALSESPIKENKALIDTLIKGYKEVLQRGFSPLLFSTIIKNRKDLLFPRIRPTFGFAKRVRNFIKIALAMKYLE